MIYLLMEGILLLIVLAYFLNGGDVLSIWLIVCAVFFVSTFVAMLNQTVWGLSLSTEAMFVIWLGLVSWGFGELLARLVGEHLRDEIPRPQDYRLIVVPRWKSVALTFVMLVATLLYFRYIVHIAQIAGNSQGLSGVFKFARYAVVNVKYQVSPGWILSQLMIISECGGSIFILVSLYNWIFLKSYSWWNIFPILVYIIQLGISTARINFIHVIGAGLIITFIFMKKKSGWSKRIDSKIIISALTGFIVFLVLFRLLGYMTDKSGSRALWNDFSIYVGSSIWGLDYFLHNRVPNPFFGMETLYNLYPKLTHYGFSTIQKYNSTLPFYYFSGQRTNVYTAIRRLVQDYGIFGMVLTFVTEGFVFSSVLNRIKRGSGSLLRILLFAFYVWIALEVSIDEEFIVTIVAPKTLYQLFYLIMLYLFFVGKGRKV